METYKSLVRETKDIRELGGLLEVYEEVAATKMQKIRKEILSSREFYEGLTRLTDDVGSDITNVISKNSREAAVFVASNAGLYGDIVERTFQIFFEYIKNHKCDIYVIGKMGNRMMREYCRGLHWQSIDLPDDTVDEKMVQKIMTQLIAYNKVHIMYGKFKNIAIQMPEITHMSGGIIPPINTDLDAMTIKRLMYLYEPSLSGISQVFAREIFVSLFTEVVQESNLAKFGSRLMHLDKSLEHIHSRLSKLDIRRRKTRKKTIDRKQNAMISAIVVRSS